MDYGAALTVPAASTADRYEEELRTSYERMLDRCRESPTSAPRRRCGAYLEHEGNACRRRVARTGPDEFSDHCPDHMDDDEFEHYEQHRSDAASAVAQAQRAEMRTIADAWIARRRRLRSWVEGMMRSA